MEILFVSLAVGCLVVCVLGLVLGRAVRLGDELWEQRLREPLQELLEREDGDWLIGEFDDIEWNWREEDAA